MGKILKFRRVSARATSEGRTMCGSGFHKWKPVAERRFDVKQTMRAYEALYGAALRVPTPDVEPQTV